jgi:hypothetical protein
LEKIQLEYIIQGVLDDEKNTEIANGSKNWYDVKDFNDNPINVHKEGTKEALKSIMLYYMCNLAEVQRIVVKNEDERYIDITAPMLGYIKENNLLSLNNVL